MAIIQTAPSSYTLDALNEEVVFGPGGVDLQLSDTDALYFQITAPTSTLDLQLQSSLDGTNWFPLSFSRQSSNASATIQLSAASYGDIGNVSHSNIPYLKFKVTAYTSGSITIVSAFSRRIFTR